MSLSSRRREVLVNIIILFTVLSVMTLGFELVLRFQYARGRERLLERQSVRELCTTFSDNPGLIYEYIPDKCGANSHGYLDDEHSLSKREGVYRIIVVGDSVAQGVQPGGRGVELQESFSKILEKKLNELNDSRRFEVIILARSGYSTSQELILLQEEAFGYDPDLVVWSYVLNDPAHPVYHNANGELGYYFRNPRVQVVDVVGQALFHARELVKARYCGDEYHERLHCVYWDEVEANVGRIGSVSRERGVPVVFLIHPVLEDVDSFDDYSLRLLHDRLGEAASGNGLVVVDLLDAYEGYSPRMVYRYLWHPNVLGHRLAGEFLFKKIVESPIL
jgi:hypothetical protein